MSKYILCPDLIISPSLRMSDKSSCNEMIWEDGKPVDPEEYDLSNLEFICESSPSGRMTDYAVSDMGCSVISSRFKELLDEAGIDNIQYFEASLVEKDGEPAAAGYYAANIIGLADCIDREKSEMRTRTLRGREHPVIFRISKLSLKDDTAIEEQLFRVKDFTRLILVDKTLKEKIAESSLRGIKLILPERWDGFNGEI